ncbi:tRNA (adenosine(37)-N6)-threonylcarbamoyltransferase complex ATPase subunit type 1 TsaE [Rickettsiales bacterium]|nr:tRNA (adenosine(37)-N6)-threonylcarbamoyltransferase complex ATPase subunit type 1 TsaE [Rickettsiales bacterium]
MKCDISSLKDSENLAKKIAALIEKGDVIALEGDLGAGKTTFTRFVINALSDKDVEVLSPTFTLVQPYELDRFNLWHFDLYRLENIEEIYELGYEEALDEGVAIIEWPQIIAGMMPENRLLIRLGLNLDTRFAEIEAYGNWKDRLNGLE